MATVLASFGVVTALEFRLYPLERAYADDRRVTEALVDRDDALLTAYVENERAVTGRRLRALRAIRAQLEAAVEQGHGEADMAAAVEASWTSAQDSPNAVS